MSRRPRRQARGLTLIELMVALVIVAVLASLALPSFGAASSRARLKAAAEQLAADLAEARALAAQRAEPVNHLPRLGDEFAGIAMLQSQAVRFEPDGQAAFARRGATALLQAGGGEQLQVEVSLLGRARICAPGGPVSGYPRC
jgi:type IV fimbrial biogenesis protein FimT